MRSNHWSSLFGAHHIGSPVFVRGRAMRTFAGLALFLTVALLCLGFYLIADEFANPRASQSFALFIGACVLAVAMILLYELIQLPRKIWRNPTEFATLALSRAPRKSGVVNRAEGLRCEQRRDLPYQRCYVDRVRVRA